MGSPQGGRSAAIHYSLVSSAKLNGVEPFAWLRDIFSELPKYRGSEAFAQAAADQPVSSDQLDHLLPDRWLKHNSSHTWNIDALRRQERRKKSNP